eukprot:gene2441-2807_t
MRKDVPLTKEEQQVTNYATRLEDSVSMCVVPVKIGKEGTNRDFHTFAMLDNCGQGTFVTKDLLKKLEIPGTPTRITIKTLSGETSIDSSTVTGLEVSSSLGSFQEDWVKLPFLLDHGVSGSNLWLFLSSLKTNSQDGSKTERAKMPKENIEAAVDAVKSGMSIRRYMKLMKGKESLADVHLGYKQRKRVLNDALEIDLVQYILKAVAIFYGITMHELRSLAYKENVQDHWLLTAPAGSGHSKASGWMREGTFVKYMKHFVKFAKPAKEEPMHLILDHHVSHISLEAINYAITKNISMLSFPPHCSHELQPLDKRREAANIQRTPSQSQHLDMVPRCLEVRNKFDHLVKGNQEKMAAIKGKRASRKFVLIAQLKKAVEEEVSRKKSKKNLARKKMLYSSVETEHTEGK